MLKLNESIVLVTGAARGMGRLHAQRAVDSGATVVLWDVDAALLETAASELGPQAHPYVVDLASLEDIERAAALVRSEVGDPNIVINNAGIVRGKRFVEHEQSADIELTMRVNALAPMHVAREFLPAMIANAQQSRIVNVASAAGLLSNPRMTVYSASKWAVVGWSDSLRLELEIEGARQVKVTTVCPSYIRTGMFEGARPPKFTGVMSPRSVVAKVWAAMEKGQPMLMLPAGVKISKVLRGILPLPAWDYAARRFGIYSSMDAFTGRPE